MTFRTVLLDNCQKEFGVLSATLEPTDEELARLRAGEPGRQLEAEAQAEALEQLAVELEQERGRWGLR